MCLWEKLQGACVLEEFQRKEVQATSASSCPSKQTLVKLFGDAASSVQSPTPAAPSQEKEAVDRLRVLLQRIDEIRDEQAFVGHTAATSQELRAERHLILDMYENDMWHRVDDAFNSGLLPKGQLVVHESSNTYSFVVKAYKAAALLWPAKSIEVGLWERDLSVKKLKWVVCYNIGDYKEVPTTFISPLSLFVQDHTRAHTHR